ncbi:hypothetical protein ACFQS3_03200 [Glycomyces mayteni]|uniref:DUF4405 domain-containing protein n=1 Tax=Glycomyces mayteni TaxID=543887 RepID=A0ABW2D1M1_9ACTN|nr:hypothetical protein GCM10025732_49660 [Glycomyces mayteni]
MNPGRTDIHRQRAISLNLFTAAAVLVFGYLAWVAAHPLSVWILGHCHVTDRASLVIAHLVYGLVLAVMSLVWRGCLTAGREAAWLVADGGEPEADRVSAGPGRRGTVALQVGAWVYSGRAPPPAR